MTFNNAAWHQRHAGSFAGPYAERGDRYLCPDCALILSREWFRSIFGCEPEDYRQIVPFRDPSDEVGANVEHRGAR